jgi:hypothetical protein
MPIDFLSIFFDPIANAKPLEALKIAIRENEDAIMDLNKQQLDRGLSAEGKDLGKYASFSYKHRWRPVDLLKTGKFRNEFSLQINDKESEIFSQDAKEAKLKKRWGNDIFGIPAPLIDNVGEIVREDFINEYSRSFK